MSELISNDPVFKEVSFADLELPRTYDTPHYLVAFSGGLDSRVLLHQMVMQYPNKVSAIHVNHGLNLLANEWETFCESCCQKYQIPFYKHKVVIDLNCSSLENEARKARYAAFESCMTPNTILVMAHHADDQLETVLMRLMRGSGLDGLCGIPRSRPLGCGVLYRPLLQYSRAQLTAYANKHNLTWVEDSSNGDSSYDRNFLRNEVIPLLKTRWRTPETTVSRVVNNLINTKTLLQTHLAPKIADCAIPNFNFAINLETLNALPIDTRKYVLYNWLKSLGFTSLTTKNLETIVALNIPFKNHEVEIYQHLSVLYALKPPVTLIDKLKILSDTTYQVKYRNTATADSNAIKTIFKSMRVPVWLRDTVPLMYQDGVFKGIPMINLPSIDNTRALLDCEINF